MCFLLEILTLTTLPSKCVCVCMCVCAQSCLTLCDPWTVAHQAPLSMDSQAGTLEHVAISSSRGSSRPREHTVCPLSPALSCGFVTTEPPGKQVRLTHLNTSQEQPWSKLPSSPWPPRRSADTRSPWAVTSLCPLLEKVFVGHVYGSWLSPSQRGRA